jgi:hypothetical protein
MEYGNIYLSMQIIGHENDVIHHLAYLRYGEALQIPVRGWSRNRDGFAGKQALQDA